MTTKIGEDMGSSRLYQRPYLAESNLVSYPMGQYVPDFVKFNGDDNKTTWQYVG